MEGPEFLCFSLDPVRIRIDHPSRNRLASTAWFAIKPTRFFAMSNTLFTTEKYKIDHNSKTKNLTKKKRNDKKKIRLEYCAFFFADC